MNIGDTVKLIKKEYPSITISRIRFLEKEGLIKPKRSKMERQCKRLAAGAAPLK